MGLLEWSILAAPVDALEDACLRLFRKITSRLVFPYVDCFVCIVTLTLFEEILAVLREQYKTQPITRRRPKQLGSTLAGSSTRLESPSSTGSMRAESEDEDINEE